MRLNKALTEGLGWLGRVRWFHHAESALIAFSLPFVMTWLVLGLRLDSSIHEWANFLHHYDIASAKARSPVEITYLVGLLVLFIIVEIARWGKKDKR